MTTDADGRFHIPAISGNINPFLTRRVRYIGAYKPGYRETVPSTSEPDVIFMERRPIDASQFDDVLHEQLPIDCKIEPRALLPVVKAKYAECISIADTPEQLHRVDGLRYLIEIIELGKEEADRRLNDRERQYILRGKKTK